MEWLLGGLTLSKTHSSVLNITDVQTDEGGEYTCRLRNEETAKERAKSISIRVYGVCEATAQPFECLVVENISVQWDQLKC